MLSGSSAARWNVRIVRRFTAGHVRWMNQVNRRKKLSRMNGARAMKMVGMQRRVDLAMENRLASAMFGCSRWIEHAVRTSQAG